MSEEQTVDLETRYQAHIVSQDNPHEVTQTQVGLSQIQNYPPATSQIAKEGVSQEHYLTARNLKDVITEYLKTQLFLDASGSFMAPADLTLSAHENTDLPALNPIPTISRDVNTLYAGTSEHGIYGKVPANDFITGEALANLVNLEAGVSINNDTYWFKYSLDNQILYFPQHSIRHSISWQNLKDAQLVHASDNTVVTIRGSLYRVRLIIGVNAAHVGSYTDITGTNPFEAKDSEWNRLLYPLYFRPLNHSPSEKWANYSSTELQLHGLGADGLYYGRRIWCQEEHQIELPGNNFTDPKAIYRYDIEKIESEHYTVDAKAFGWRPVLELVN